MPRAVRMVGPRGKGNKGSPPMNTRDPNGAAGLSRSSSSKINGVPSDSDTEAVPVPAPSPSHKMHSLSAHEFLEHLEGKQHMSAAEQRKLLESQNIPWTKRMLFQGIVAFFISANAVCLGLEADYGEQEKDVFGVLEHVFTVVFVIELILRMYTEGPRAYFAEQSSCLDFVLVLLAVIDVWIITPLGGASGLRTMSLLRLIRLLRLLRLLRLFRIFKELSMIIAGFVSSGKTLFWAGVFLAIVVYIFAIFATQRFGKAEGDPDMCTPGVVSTTTSPGLADGLTRLLKGGQSSSVSSTTKFSNQDGCDQYTFEASVGDQYSLFGTVDRSILTLYMCVFEGCGFEIIYPMAIETPWVVIFWYIFTFITSFGIMNVIIGLFCENVLDAAMAQEKDQAKKSEEVRKEHLENLKNLFLVMDSDNSQTITRNEFMSAMGNNEEVIKTMEELGLSEDASLFDTLDVNQSGTLSLQEFFQGMMLLMNANQPTRAKDIVSTYLTVQSLQHHTHVLQEKMMKNEVTLKHILRVLVEHTGRGDKHLEDVLREIDSIESAAHHKMFLNAMEPSHIGYTHHDDAGSSQPSQPKKKLNFHHDYGVVPGTTFSRACPAVVARISSSHSGSPKELERSCSDQHQTDETGGGASSSKPKKDGKKEIDLDMLDNPCRDDTQDDETLNAEQYFNKLDQLDGDPASGSTAGPDLQSSLQQLQERSYVPPSVTILDDIRLSLAALHSKFDGLSARLERVEAFQDSQAWTGGAQHRTEGSLVAPKSPPTVKEVYNCGPAGQCTACVPTPMESSANSQL